eukprot:386098_1
MLFTQTVAMFIVLSIGFIYCCIFLILCIYHFCISTTILTNEISVLQFLIGLYVGFWTLKYLFATTYVGLLYYDEINNNEQDIIQFTQRICGGIATKLLYVIIIIRVYYTFKDTIYKLDLNVFFIYFSLLFVSWIIDLIADIYVVILKYHIFNLFYGLQSIMELTLGIVFIYQFNHRLFQLICSQSSYDFHYGSARNNNGTTHTPYTTSTVANKNNNVISDMMHKDSLILNPKQISFLHIITKNTLLATTAIISYDIFIITCSILELHPYDITNLMVPLHFIQIFATFIEMLCIYLTFNWSENTYNICCKYCHKHCQKCCRQIAKNKIKGKHSRYEYRLSDTELI